MIALLTILLILPLSVAFGAAILKPFDTAMTGVARPTRFAACDFPALMAMLAMPLALLSMDRSWGDSSLRLFLGSLVVAVVIFIWWCGTATLSGLLIFQASRRCVFLILLLPIALGGGALAIPILVVMTLALGDWDNDALALWLTGVGGLCIAAFLLNRVAHWVLKGAHRRKEEWPVDVDGAESKRPLNATQSFPGESQNDT